MASSVAAPRVRGSRPGAPPGFGSRRTHRRRALRCRRSCTRRASSAAAEDIINVKDEMNAKLDTKVDNVAWREANDDLCAAIQTVRDMVSSLRQDVDERRRKVDETLVTIRHDVTTVEINLEESKAKTTRYIAQAVNALRGRIDVNQRQAPMVQTVQETVEVPQAQYIDKVQRVPATKQRQVPMVQTAQKTVEVPQVQYTDHARDVLVTKQRDVPMVQTGQKTVEVPKVQCTDNVQEAPVMKQRQVPMVQTVQKTVEVPQGQHADKVLDVPVTKQRQVPMAQDAIEAGDLVELRGLLSRPELNGAWAVPNEYRADKDRWATELLSTSECLLLKSCNLKIIRKWRDAATNGEAGWEEPDKG